MYTETGREIPLETGSSIQPEKDLFRNEKALTLLRYIHNFFLLMTKTFSAKAQDVERKWYVIDADGQVVGKIAERAARLLRGKDKAIFTPHCDTGDHVVIINADKAVFTGKKETDKVYHSYSGYVGGHKSENPKDRRKRRPELILERAVRGMIPHNRLGRSQFTKLHVYAGTEHPHEAQKPEALAL